MHDTNRQDPTCPKCGIAAHSSVRIFTTRSYERAIRRLLPEADRRAMEAAVVADPRVSAVIRGTGGLRKVRWAGSGRGKRGGIRTIYFRHGRSDSIYLLTAYAKADREDLSPADIK
ncbi:MAG: type II toxin-antitoxin system RelE/ParE family toxin, partial [Gemmatimonadota bacterium]|nr:type II toxin-antitoxin system RelE/ParE family toxin [Gemmatimonadota bacterium]